jgi:hypothetical protein
MMALDGERTRCMVARLLQASLCGGARRAVMAADGKTFTLGKGEVDSSIPSGGTIFLSSDSYLGCLPAQ